MQVLFPSAFKSTKLSILIMSQDIENAVQLLRVSIGIKLTRFVGAFGKRTENKKHISHAMQRKLFTCVMLKKKTILMIKTINFI